MDASKGFILGGISAGGNLSAVLSHLARDHSLDPPLTGVYLGVPLVVHHTVVPEKYAVHYRSRDQLVDAAIIPRQVMNLMETYHQPDPSSPLYSPLLWPTGHHGLPRTYIQVAGRDPLRSDGLIYEEVLRSEAEVEVRIDVYAGVPHIFNAVWPELTLSKKYNGDLRSGFGWLLRRGSQEASR